MFASLAAVGSPGALALVLFTLVAGLALAAAVASAPRPTAQAKVRRILDTLLGSRTTLVWLTTDDERAAEAMLAEVGAARGYATYLWDSARGVMDATGKQCSGEAGEAPRLKPRAPAARPGDAGPDVDGRTLAAPPAMLDYIRKSAEKALYVVRDVDDYLRDPSLGRRLRSLCRDLLAQPLTEARVVVVLTPSSEVPPKLATDATVVQWPRPEEGEWPDLIRALVSRQPAEVQQRVLQNGTVERAAKACCGLSAKAGGAILRRALVERGSLDADYLSEAKRALVESQDAMVWTEPQAGGTGAIGGLGRLKAYLKQALKCMGDKARSFGLTPPKGILLLGIPGTGKTYTAKCLGSESGLPVITLKVSSLESKWVGEGVVKARRAFQTIDGLGPCIVVIDEVEKGLAGASGEQGDGGSSRKLLGEVLSWMQDRTSSAFVVLTANDVSALPPELLRKGRVDECFFVDVPNTTDRADVLRVALKQAGRDAASVDADAVARATDGFVGAEVAALVQSGLRLAYLADRDLTTDDLLEAAKATVPLSVQQRERIQSLREWAAGRAVRANDPESDTTTRPAGTPGSAADATELDLS